MIRTGIVAFLVGALPCLAGTNVTVRVIGDQHSDSHFQIYTHGTNVVLTVQWRGKGTWISSEAAGYSVTHIDENGDGIAEDIMISRSKGPILECLHRAEDGQFMQAPQERLDEMNAMAKKIEAGIPRQER